MILPPGHVHALREKRRLSAREKWMIRAALAAVAAVIVAVVISVATSGHTTGNGCIDVSIPYSTGGQEIYRCGGPARALCRLVGAPGGYTGQSARAIATECRKARLPMGP